MYIVPILPFQCPCPCLQNEMPKTCDHITQKPHVILPTEIRNARMAQWMRSGGRRDGRNGNRKSKSISLYDYKNVSAYRVQSLKKCDSVKLTQRFLFFIIWCLTWRFHSTTHSRTVQKGSLFFDEIIFFIYDSAPMIFTFNSIKVNTMHVNWKRREKDWTKKEQPRQYIELFLVCL